MIGQWVARYSGARRVTLWHFVGSLIEDRAVTHCGRQMHRKTSKGVLILHEFTDYPQCQACYDKANP